MKSTQCGNGDSTNYWRMAGRAKGDVLRSGERAGAGSSPAACEGRRIERSRELTTVDVRTDGDAVEDV
jgi:hypothetical protein